MEAADPNRDGRMSRTRRRSSPVTQNPPKNKQTKEQQLPHNGGERSKQKISRTRRGSNVPCRLICITRSPLQSGGGFLVLLVGFCCCCCCCCCRSRAAAVDPSRLMDAAVAGRPLAAGSVNRSGRKSELTAPRSQRRKMLLLLLLFFLSLRRPPSDPIRSARLTLP